jgi:hypothetical protein
MPNFRQKPPETKFPTTLKFDWDNFGGGLNTLFKDTELKNNELAQATNLMLVGKGIPTKRWGTALYHLSGGAGSVRGLSGFYQVNGTNQLLAISDQGFLTRKSNASYSTLTGVSWASGANVEMQQLDNRMYIVGGNRELARYSNPTLVGFPTIGRPLSTFATQISGVSGTNTISYRLTHTTAVGETASADSYQIVNQPKELSKGAVRVQWTNASTASGIRKGTNVYAGSPGEETFRAFLDSDATQWIDDGTAVTSQFAFAPTTDTTGGVKAKYIKRFKDRLVYAGIDGEPTKVVISGRQPFHEKFDIGSGGGSVLVEPDSGDNITGLEVKADKIIVFKERSIWEVTLEEITYKEIQGIALKALAPKTTLITSSIGCASHRTIVHVENDILFLANNNRGCFVLGNEPGIIGDILRTNEVSVKIRPFFESLTATQESNACAIYYNNKYFVGIPGRNETMVFDRERNAWVGPWSFDANLFHVYYEADGTSRLLKGDDDTAIVRDIAGNYPGDNGNAINTILRTKRIDWGDWTKFKNIKNIFTLWREVSGSVSADIRLEQRTGNTLTAKSFTISTRSGNAGWGSDLWANSQWGDTEQSGKADDLSEIVRQAFLQKAARNAQLVVKTTNLNDNYQLMSVKGEAQIIGEFRPTSWKV